MIRMDCEEHAYVDALPLIRATCARFQRRYGGNLDDHLSRADEAFVRAWRGHDPDKGPFDKQVRYYVWMGLFGQVRDAARRNGTLRRTEMPFDVPDVYSGQERLDRRLREASEDARLAAGLVLLGRKINNPARIKETLVEFLLDAGWGAGRILGAFKELGDLFR